MKSFEEYLRGYMAGGRCHLDVEIRDLGDGGIRMEINPQGSKEDVTVFLFRDQLKPTEGFQKEAVAAFGLIESARESDIKIGILKKGIEELWHEALAGHIIKIG